MAISSERILGLGDDQILSQYSLIFPEGIPGGGDSESITLRADQSIDLPENSVNTYDIFHKGFKITKTGMLQETTKEISFDVRIDQQWKVVDDYLAWEKMCYDHNNGTALPDSMVRTSLIVQPEDRNQAAVKQILFKGIKPKSSKLPTFDNSSGDPARMTMTFIFTEMVIGE